MPVLKAGAKGGNDRRETLSTLHQDESSTAGFYFSLRVSRTKALPVARSMFCESLIELV